MRMTEGIEHYYLYFFKEGFIYDGAISEYLEVLGFYNALFIGRVDSENPKIKLS